MKGGRYTAFILLLTALLAAVSLLSMLFGSVPLSLGDIREGFLYIMGAGGDESAALILFSLRLPRTILAIAVGAALSLSGAAFQGLFRNTLADPYVIGASSGAALGAAIAVASGIQFSGPLSSLSLLAFAGALLAVTLAFVISRAAGNPPPAAALLLAGASLSAFFSALLSLILTIKDKNLHRVYYWLLGSLAGLSRGEMFSQLPLMGAGCVLIFLCARPLDLLLQGDESAESLGLDVGRTRIMVGLGAAVATAAAVSAAGIIGFIGLVAPHAARFFTGPVHRRLLPASALLGAVLLVLADIAARTVASPAELPVGIISSLLGAPFFIYLLLRRGKSLGKL